MASKVFQIYDGDWVSWERTGNRLRCCDCELAHRINFRIRKGKIQTQHITDRRATAAARRANGVKVTRKK